MLAAAVGHDHQRLRVVGEAQSREGAHQTWEVGQTRGGRVDGQGQWQDHGLGSWGGAWQP